LGEWLFWWLSPKNNSAHEGKARPRPHRRSPKTEHFACGASAIRTASEAASHHAFSAHPPSDHRSSTTASSPPRFSNLVYSFLTLAIPASQ